MDKGFWVSAKHLEFVVTGKLSLMCLLLIAEVIWENTFNTPAFQDFFLCLSPISCLFNVHIWSKLDKRISLRLLVMHYNDVILAGALMEYHMPMFHCFVPPQSLLCHASRGQHHVTLSQKKQTSQLQMQTQTSPPSKNSMLRVHGAVKPCYECPDSEWVPSSAGIFSILTQACVRLVALQLWWFWKLCGVRDRDVFYNGHVPVIKIIFPVLSKSSFRHSMVRFHAIEQCDAIPVL